MLPALAMARMGNKKPAEMLSLQLDNAWPLGTCVQNIGFRWFERKSIFKIGSHQKAIDDLASVTPPLEFAIPPALGVATRSGP